MKSPAELIDLQERIRLTPGSLIGSRIKLARVEAGLSHDRLGALLDGITRQHLIKLEKSTHRPQAKTLVRIAEATGKPVDWFFVQTEASVADFASLGESIAEVLRREVRAVIEHEMSSRESTAA